MKTIHKVVCCLPSEVNGRKEILSFLHPPPVSHIQIPKGTVEKDENLEEATLREFHEETV